MDFLFQGIFAVLLKKEGQKNKVIKQQKRTSQESIEQKTPCRIECREFFYIILVKT